MEPAADSHSIPRYPSADRSDSSHGQTGRPTVYLYTKYNDEQKVCMSIWTSLAAFKRHLIAMERTPLAYRWMLWSDVEQDLIDHLDSHPYDQRGGRATWGGPLLGPFKSTSRNGAQRKDLAGGCQDDTSRW